MSSLPSPSLWRDRQFRTFWSAQGVSEFGDRITELALPLIAVTLLDASPGQVGLLTAAVWLPNIASMLISSADGLLAVLWLIRSPIIHVRSLEGLKPPD